MTPGQTFVLQGIQEWGQSEANRIAAVQGVLDAAGFDAKAICWPVFGGIWGKQCEGPDGEAATRWLQNLTDTMQRGEFNEEAAHVDRLIGRRQKALEVKE